MGFVKIYFNCFSFINALVVSNIFSPSYHRYCCYTLILAGDLNMVIPLVTIVLVGLLQWTVPTDSARILAVESIAGKSHWNFMRAVLRALTDNGHTVTVFTPFPDGDRANYTEVDLSPVFPIKLDLDVSEIIEKFIDPRSIVPLCVVISRTLCDAIYDHDRMKDILQNGDQSGDGSNNEFDVILVEPLGSDCVSYMATKLGLPMIYVIPSPLITHYERDFLGNIPNPAVVSHLLAGHAVPRTFVQRFTNTILSAYTMFSIKYNAYKLAQADPKPYDFVTPVQPSAVFVNTHFISEISRPTPPNVIQVGGVHLEQPKSIPHVRNRALYNFPNLILI